MYSESNSFLLLKSRHAKLILAILTISIYFLLALDSLFRGRQYLIFGLILCAFSALALYRKSLLLWPLLLATLSLMAGIYWNFAHLLKDVQPNLFGFLHGAYAAVFLFLFFVSTISWGSLVYEGAINRGTQARRLPKRMELAIYLGLGLICNYFAAFILAAYQLVSEATLFFLIILPIFLQRKVVVLLVQRVCVLAKRYLKLLLRMPALFMICLLYASFVICGGLYDDALTYHILLPKEILDHGGFSPTTSNLNTYHPPLVSLQYLYFYALVGAQYCSLINFILTPFLLYILVLLAKKCFGVRSGLSLILLILSEDLIQHALNRANVDLCLSYFCLLSLTVFLLSKTQLSLEKSQIALLCGLFCGASLASKYTASIYIIVFGFLFLLNGERNLKIFKNLLLLVSGFLFAVLPFMARNYHYTANPFAPIFREFFDSQVPIEETKLKMAMDNVWMPELDLFSFVTRPLDMYLHGKFTVLPYDSSVTPFYLIAFPIAVVLIYRKATGNVLLLYCLSAFMLWSFLFPITRYLFPVVLLLSCMTVRVLEFACDDIANSQIKFINRRGIKHLPYLFFSAMLCFCCADLALSNRRAFFGPFSFFQQLDPENVYGLSDSYRPYDISKYLNANLSSTNKAFYIFDTQTLLTSPYAIGDSYFTHLGWLQSMLKRGEDPIAKLRSKGISYIVMDHGRFSWIRNDQINKYGNKESVVDAKAYLDLSMKSFENTILPRLAEVAKSGSRSVYSFK